MKVLLPPQLPWTHVSLNPNFSCTLAMCHHSPIVTFRTSRRNRSRGQTHIQVNKSIQTAKSHTNAQILIVCTISFFPLLTSIPLIAYLSSPEVHRSKHEFNKSIPRQCVRVADTKPSNQIEPLRRRQFPSLWSKVNSLSTVLQLKHCRPTSATLRNLAFCYVSCYRKKGIELFLFKCTSLVTGRI